jgi:hypothetical protein
MHLLGKFARMDPTRLPRKFLTAWVSHPQHSGGQHYTLRTHTLRHFSIFFLWRFNKPDALICYPGSIEKLKLFVATYLPIFRYLCNSSRVVFPKPWSFI